MTCRSLRLCQSARLLEKLTLKDDRVILQTGMLHMFPPSLSPCPNQPDGVAATRCGLWILSVPSHSSFFFFFGGENPLYLFSYICIPWLVQSSASLYLVAQAH